MPQALRYAIVNSIIQNWLTAVASPKGEALASEIPVGVQVAKPQGRTASFMPGNPSAPHERLASGEPLLLQLACGL